MLRHLTRRQRRKQSLKRLRLPKPQTRIPEGPTGNSILHIWRSAKQKLTDIGYTTKRWLVKPTIRLFKHYQIKEDFYQIYAANVSELCNNPNLVSRTFPEKKEWLKRANYCSNQCVTIDPHEKVTKFIENLQKNFKKLDDYSSKILKFVFAIAVLFCSSTIFTFFNFISDQLFLLSFAGSVAFLAIGGYLYLLNKDTDFFHMINKELRISPYELNKIYRKTRWDKAPIITATVWNCSLTDYRMISRMFLLVLIKMSWRSLYERIFTGLKTVLPTYLEELGKLLEIKNHKLIRKLVFKAAKETMRL